LADPKELAGEHEEQCVVTQIDFSGGLVGENLLLLSLENARKLAAVMLASYGQVPEEVPGDDLTEVELSAVSEIMNQMMGASAKAYGELLSEVVEITPPEVEVRDVTGSLMSDLEDGEDSELVTTSFSLMVDGEVSTQVLQVMEAPFARELASTMMNSFVIDEEPEEPVEDDNPAAVEEPAAPGTHTEAQGASAAAIIDVLGEIGNIATGAASTALAQLMEKDVRITTPEVEPTGPESLVEQYPVPCVVAKISFKGGIKGENLLLLRVENARELAEVMLASYGQVPTTESSDELTEVELSAVSEIMNQMMGASAKAYGELLSEVVEISPPDLEIREVTTDLVSGYEGMPDEDLITIRFSLMVDGAMATQVLQVMEAPFARELASTMITGQLASTMMSSVVGDNEPEAESPSPGPQDSQEPAAVEPTGLAAEGIDDLLGGEAAEEKEAAAAQEDEQNEGRLELPYLTKFSVTISALFGRATPSLETLASLDRGSALQLNRQVDEAVLLRVNDMDFAYGELVTVDGQIGVRIVGFIEPEPGGGILDERAYSE
jgi:flagellar motor switch protein FliN/FliY